MKTAVLLACSLVSGSTFAQSSFPEEGNHAEHIQEDHSGHQGHLFPAIGVMGAHTHPVGDWMISYRFMRMEMDGNRNGNNGLSASEVLSQFPVTPLNMTMDMHMFGGMYGVNDSLTIGVMIPYVRLEMDHRTGMGAEFTTRSEGLGDIRVTGLYELSENGPHQVIAQACVSIPTGSIDEEDETPASGGNEVQLPYPMQLGSGTWDLLPGLTYLFNGDPWACGAQVVQTVRLGENDRDYRLGSRIEANLWTQRSFGAASGTLRVNAAQWRNIHGADPDINPAMVPTADPNRRGGSRVDLLAGLQMQPHSGSFAGHRLGFEFGVPVYQYLDGPQLETDWILTLGYTYSR